MIRWLVQTVVDHPDLTATRPPAGLLTPVEREHFEGYLSPRRRRDWLLGRWTAKRLVQTHVAATDGFSPGLNTFTIENEVNGAPFVASYNSSVWRGYSDGRLPLVLAISHSHGYAFCAICSDDSGEVRLGVDIELVEHRQGGFVEEFFTIPEQKILDTTNPDRRDFLITATWSIKEAVLKATHLGLRADLRSVECVVHSVPFSHWTPRRVIIQSGVRAESGVDGPLTAWYRVIENRLRPGNWFVLTIAAYNALL